MSAPPKQDVAALVADLLDDDDGPVDDDDNLIECGLDSMAMMRIAARWRAEGYDVTFAQLASDPTIAAWRALLGEAPVVEGSTGCGAVVEQEGVDGDPFELADLQHAYWVGRNAVQELGGVSAHFYNEFDGRGVDPGRLEAAVRAVLDRHGMLRVRVHDDGTQSISAASPWPGLRVHDLRGSTAEQAEVELGRIRGELSHRVLDVAAGEVFDVQLSLLPDALREGGTRLHLGLDMIAADAISLRVLLGDLADAYRGVSLPAIGYSYPRYRRDRRARRERDDRVGIDRRYWSERLPELPAAPALPAAAGGGLDATTVVRRSRLLSAAETAAFSDRARARGLTPAMALAAVFAETLTSWSADPRFVLNVPLFDREPLHPEVSDLVGDFTSSVLLAWDGSLAGTVTDRALALQHRFHIDVAHSAFCGVDVLRELSRLHGERVLAPVVYTSAIGMGDLFAPQVREQFGEASWIVSQGPQVWLDAQVTELGGGLLVNWDAREHAFAPGVVDAMFDRYLGLLEAMVAADAPWDAPPPSTLPAGQRSVRDRVNATSVPREPRTLHHAVFARATETPDRPALLWGEDRSITYGELARRALAGAATLRGRGVRHGDPVAVLLPKGPEQVVAVLAVLAAGGVYVPIGTEQPARRVGRIRAVSGVHHMITEPVPASATPLSAPADVDPDDLAYVLHTSGSTGEPKGVEITHAAATNTIDDLLARFAIGADDRTIALSELEFDLSVFDVFAPLSVGGALVCVGADERRDAAAWVRLVERHAVTVVNAAPAIVDMLVTAADGRPLGLRTVLTGGDVVGADLPRRLREVAPGSRFAGLGGTTETAIHSTVFEVGQLPAGATSVPYGVPLAGVVCRVVDVLGRDRPDWVPGELWIGGAGVARGYRGRPELTADRFVTHDGVPFYRTGDVARYLPDGTLEFLGRSDHQVKVRGLRIELGEVEAAFTAHPAVESAVACVHREGSLGAVVCVPDPRAAPDSDALLRAAAERLPSAMRPEVVAVVRRWPLTPNGKIDRQAVAALLADRAAARARPREAPRTAVEQVVARAWADLLGIAEVGRDSEFFALGGDSLLATRLVARLRADGVEGVALSALFARPVLADFAATLHLGGTASDTARLVAEPDAEYDPFELTDVQRAYWLGRSPRFTLGGVGCHFYREYAVDGLDIARLEAAVDRLVRRHPMLRAVIGADGTQRVLEEVPPFRVSVVDVDGVNGGCDGDPDDLRVWRDAASHRTFDPARWPLIAIDAVRVRRPDGTPGPVVRLGIGVDNIVLDALSILLFYTELGVVYDDQEAELPPIGLTFRDYVRQVRPEPDELAAAERFWLDRTASLPPAPALPTAVSPERIAVPRFVRHETVVDAATWDALCARARGHQVTPSAVLLAAYAEVLARWSAQAELTLTVTLFDRRDDVHPDVHRVLGDFTSLALVSHRAQAERSLLDTVRTVQDELWQALDHREVSAVRVLRELARQRGEPDLTMPVVFTSALGVPGGTAAPRSGPFAHQVGGVSQTPQVWLDHQVTEVDGGIAVNWDVVADLFPAGLIPDAFAAYVRLLRDAAQGDWSRPIEATLPPSQAAVRAAVNAVPAPPVADRLLHGPFFAAARSQPDRVAIVVPNGEDVTYGVLAERALRLAGDLVRSGVGPGDAVAVRLPKGPGQVVAVLGVLAAGGAYVPVGVEQPPERVAVIRGQAGALQLVDEERLVRSTCAEPLDLPVPVDADAPAYVIFTSGSTGEPKGVEIAHASARNTVVDVGERFGIGRDDRVLAVSALDFDLSVYDVFGPLAAGGALVVIGEDERRDARAWVRLVRDTGVTVWNSVPALVDMLLLAGENAPGALHGLRVVLASGDWVGIDLPARLRAQAPACRFVALGGATEASIWSNFFEVVPGAEPDGSWRSVPYGYPLGGQEFRVVDSLGRDCPDWVAGELWIGGDGVALGYRGEAETTASRFPVVDGRRWYRTGDLGRYRSDGTLEFLGRSDHQVKVRGHRIELGEVETALLGCDGVGSAVAAVSGTGHAARLVAAVVPELPAHRPETAARVDPGLRADVVAERDRNREVESRVAAAALATVLRLPAGGETTVHRLGVAPEHRAVVERWLTWLERAGVVARCGDLLVRGGRLPDPDFADTPYQRLLAEAHRRLIARTDDLRSILAGRAEASTLVDDPVLAPAALAAADPGTAPGLDRVADRIRALARTLGRSVRAIELGGRSGATAAALLTRLDPGEVDYTLADESSAMAASARERLAGGPHTVSFALLSGDRVPEQLLHGFDVVVATHVLHRFADPAGGLLFAAALLAPCGELLIIEREELTPLAMITAGLLDGGWTHLDPRRRATGSPMLTGTQWADELTARGFVDITQDTLGTSFAAFLRGVWPATAPTLDLEAVRERLSRRLPPHMMPERLGVVPVPPLSANGKVDRVAVAALLPPEIDTAPDDAPTDDLERGIAALWKELLGVPEVGRGQSFFALGGDSLTANRFVEAASARLGLTIPLRVLFAGPTLAEVAAAARPADDVEEGEL